MRMPPKRKRAGELALAPVPRFPGSELGARGSKTRNKIIVAARKMLNQQGYAATNFEDIAIEAQVSRASVYTYFPSKRDLLLTIAIEDNRRYQEFGAVLARALEQPIELVRLRTWVEDYVDYFSEGQVTFGVWDEAASSDEQLRVEGLRQHMHAWGNVGRAIDTARGTPADTPELEGLIVLAAIDRICFYTNAAGAVFSRDKVVDSVVSLILMRTRNQPRPE
jgi:AcrR family transcriptional regulator